MCINLDGRRECVCIYLMVLIFRENQPKKRKIGIRKCIVCQFNTWSRMIYIFDCAVIMQHNHMVITIIAFSSIGCRRVVLLFSNLRLQKVVLGCHLLSNFVKSICIKPYICKDLRCFLLLLITNVVSFFVKKIRKCMKPYFEDKLQAWIRMLLDKPKS